MEAGVTDLKRWRLDSIQGAHRWRYLSQTESAVRPQTKAEKQFLGIQDVCIIRLARVARD